MKKTIITFLLGVIVGLAAMGVSNHFSNKNVAKEMQTKLDSLQAQVNSTPTHFNFSFLPAFSTTAITTKVVAGKTITVPVAIQVPTVVTQAYSTLCEVAKANNFSPTAFLYNKYGACTINICTGKGSIDIAALTFTAACNICKKPYAKNYFVVGGYSLPQNDFYVGVMWHPEFIPIKWIEGGIIGMTDFKNAKKLDASIGIGIHPYLRDEPINVGLYGGIDLRENLVLGIQFYLY